ncbi:GIY-YIG nuclease family protein [Algibacter sp. TI.3.09]|uniref:GIY-YIG nuclease family protein n=1 Tax=Algibacter sp. TI.3.09 TaxID=3121298 RepID=UPI00311DFC45
MQHQYYVYILTNKYRTTLYIGFTNNIQNRLSQHYFDSQNAKKSFAGKYDCIYLVYYEVFESPKPGIEREKQLKKWRREKKNKLISDFNTNWESLNNQIF